MSQQKVQDLMRQVHSSRVKYVYRALVDIKENLINSSREPGCVKQLVSSGLVKRLLQIIRSRDNLEEKYRSKVIELSISLLGNMCMEEVSRKQVIKFRGIGLLDELFAETETESLQNRTCRCLANMLNTPSRCKLAHKTSIVELISKRLGNTDLKEDTKKTFIRAIRLLGQTGSYVQKVVEMNAVGAVLKYVDCDSEEVCQSALRCLNSLSTHGCSFQIATQVVASGKIPYLIDLIKHHNEDAFHLVVRLHNNHNFRPEFGNAGGIAASYEMFKLDDTNTEKWKPYLLNVLCLCCKEPENRVKLREQNILKVFLESLSDKRFTSLHQQIVIALMCFLYDEPSIEVLLENGMVKVLIQLLNSYMYGSDGDNDSDVSRTWEMFLNRKINKVASKSTVFENNILILLSRVSQMNDPTAHLVTMKVLCGLLDYISIMEAPLTRCARLLSRIFRNPACFKKLISLHAPTLIYCTLLHDVDVTLYRAKMASAKGASSFFDAQREVSSDSDRYSMTDEDEVKLYKTQTYKGVYHQQEEEVCAAGKCGLAFLEDLSCVADSKYGQGTSDRLFHTLPENQHLDICITHIFIVWSAGARKFYFHHRKYLDLVLSLLQSEHVTPTPQFSVAVMALSFLAKIIDTKKKYQSTDGMDECRDSAPNDDIASYVAISITDCEWQTNLPMDRVFITKDGNIQANKSTLIKQSEVFLAMLDGHFLEAHLSQISMPETSTNAFRYINHYMHGCKRRSCPVLQYLYSDEVSIEMVLLCIEVIFEADMWMLIPLKDQMTECLYNRLIIPVACQDLLVYSTIFSVDKVRKAAVSSLLTDSLDCDQLIELTADILGSDLANVFLHTLVEIFVEA